MRVISAVDFFSPAEVAALAAKTGVSQSSTFAKRQVQLLGFQQALGSRIGFPQKTIATAQQLLLRFFLFYSPAEFVPHEVALACTSVASKINDTPKKPREIILSSWALRYPDLVRSAASLPSTSKAGNGNATTGQSPHLGLGVVSESDVDPAVLEKERKRVIAIESLILKGIAFQFNTTVNECLRLTVKIGRLWGLDREAAKLAWQVCADCHRTYSPLYYPASTIALASIYLAGLLLQLRDNEPAPSSQVESILKHFNEVKGLPSNFLTSIDVVDEAVHNTLDAYLASASALHASSVSASATPISPATPASPAEPATVETFAEGRGLSASAAAVRKVPGHVYSPPPFGVLFCVQELDLATDLASEFTRIKITLRQREDERRGDHASPTIDLTTAAQLVRPFEIGGFQGDSEDRVQNSETLVAAWEKRGEDKQYASLQRYLF